MHRALLVATLALLALPAAPAAAAAREPAPQDDWMVHVRRTDDGWRFVPETIVLVPGGLVQLMIFGPGAFSLTLDDHPELSADVPDGPATVRTAEFRAPAQPGDYPFHDKQHPEARGVLLVRPREDAPPAVGVVPGGYEAAFAPARLEVAPGATVTFRANGSFQHNLQSVGGAFSAGDVRAGSEATFTAPAEPGEYPFVCRFHEAQGMRGVLVVRAADAPTPPAGAEVESRSETPALGSALALAGMVMAALALVASLRKPR